MVAQADKVKDLLLQAKDLDGVKNFFYELGFADIDLEDSELIVTVDEQSNYIQVVPVEKPAEIDSLSRRYESGRQALLAILPGYDRWVFAKMGLEEKQKILRYRIDKQKIREQENPLAIQRLMGLKFDKPETIDELFERKDISKKFYEEFSRKKIALSKQIQGIDDIDDRRWYATVLLNRIIFLYFLQQQGILDGNERYLNDKFTQYTKGKKSFYRRFLRVLFFDTLCTQNRSQETEKITGKNIPYLNGGLFLEHNLEKKYTKIDVDNRAFGDLFAFFDGWFWNPSERNITDEDQIDPYILGYIFEKSLGENKSGGVYYTPPSLAQFLTKETIANHLRYRLGLDGQTDPHQWLERTNAQQATKFYETVRDLKVLDPACGSGQFLVEALHELQPYYTTLMDLASQKGYKQLDKWLKKDLALSGNKERDLYYIRRHIVSQNLFGVDLLHESTEITKLRLFLGMIEGAEGRITEPLPNIDFNIRYGNSLVGFVQPADLDSVRNLFNDMETKQKERLGLIHEYETSDDPKRARKLKDQIEKIENSLYEAANERFDERASTEWKIRPNQKIDFVDDLSKYPNLQRKIKETYLKANDVAAFHWPIMFREVYERSNAGFDVVLMNPPWEVWKPNSQEFFERHIKDFRSLDKRQAREAVKKAFKKKPLLEEWVDYNKKITQSAKYFTNSGEYPRRGSGDLNLYKFFLERSFYALNQRGTLGLVIPSGLYTDKGSTELRKLLFGQSRLHFLYGFENRKAIFEGIHRSFKFILLSTSKSEAGSDKIPAAFMMHSEKDLAKAHQQAEGSRYVEIPVSMLPRISGETRSLMEFKSQREIDITAKIYGDRPLLGDELKDTWNVKFAREFDMTNDSHLFVDHPQLEKKGATYDEATMIWTGKKGERYLPLYEGKMIWQYNAYYGKPRYWVEEKKGRKAILGKQRDTGQKLDYQRPRLAFRDVAANTNERTFVSTLIPICFHNNKLPTMQGNQLSIDIILFIISQLNSFVLDYIIRQKVSSTLNFFYVESMPLEPIEKHKIHKNIVDFTKELLYRNLGAINGLKNNKVLSKKSDIQLKNQIDALVAKMYGLDRKDLEYILSTFPLVEDGIKEGVLAEFDRL